MKFLISSDFHLNERNRLNDYIKNLKEIEKISQKAKPDYYVVVGDIFDKRRPSPLELKVFSEHINKMRVSQINIIIGNHDEVGKDLTTLDWIKSKRIEVSKVKVYNVKGKTIYFAHRTLSEAKLGPKEIHIEGISYKKLKYDAIVCGHIHKSQVLSKKNPLALIPGSIERVNFGERGEEKWVWLLDVGDKIKLKKYPLECRRMFYIVRNLDTKETFVNDRNWIEGEDITSDAIVKVKFVGKKSTINKLNYDKLLNIFDKTFSIDMQFDYTDKVKEASIITTKIISDKEILDNYCKDNEVKEKVKKITERILNNES